MECLVSRNGRAPSPAARFSLFLTRGEYQVLVLSHSTKDFFGVQSTGMSLITVYTLTGIPD